MVNPDQDPTLVRNQPALRGSGGTEWVVIGVLLAAITITVLLLTGTVAGRVGAAVNGAVLVAMVVVRFFAPLQRPRLWTLAMLLVVMAAVSLVVILATIAVH